MPIFVPSSISDIPHFALKKRPHPLKDYFLLQQELDF